MWQGWAVLGLGVLAASPAVAGDSAPMLVQALKDCRAVADSTARLSCYDRATAAFEVAVAAKDVVVVDREQVKRDRRKQFGFIKPQPAAVDAGVPEPVELKGKVSALSLWGDFFVVAVEGSGTWRTTESGFAAPALGEPVTIKKGTLGSYVMLFRAGALRVRRLR